MTSTRVLISLFSFGFSSLLIGILCISGTGRVRRAVHGKTQTEQGYKEARQEQTSQGENRTDKKSVDDVSNGRGDDDKMMKVFAQASALKNVRPLASLPDQT